MCGIGTSARGVMLLHPRYLVKRVLDLSCWHYNCHELSNAISSNVFSKKSAECQLCSNVETGYTSLVLKSCVVTDLQPTRVLKACTAHITPCMLCACAS